MFHQEASVEIIKLKYKFVHSVSIKISSSGNHKLVEDYATIGEALLQKKVIKMIEKIIISK